MGRRRLFKNSNKVNKMPLYIVWIGMKSRCYNPKAANYKYYGARGIRVCEEWREDFMPFYKWAKANGYRKGLTIDRENNDGEYSPSNCRWVTQKEQVKNKRISIQSGELHFRAKLTEEKVIHIRKRLYSNSEYSKMYGVSPSTISSLLSNYKRWPNALP